MPGACDVYLKLEIFREKESGNMQIIVHFDLNSPNVFKEEGDYIWMPTITEKNLINDTFELFSSSKTTSSTGNENTDPSNEQGGESRKEQQILPKETSADEKIIIDKVLIQKKDSGYS